MNAISVKAALAEAREFVRRAEEWEKRYDQRNPNYYFSVPKEAGAVRRSSMDLTRALAAMRKPG